MPVIIAGIIISSILLAWLLPLKAATRLLEEEGIYERISPWLWFVLALACLAQTKLRLPTRLACAAMAVLLACREMDLHKSLFQMSFLKTNFYRSAEIPLAQKFLGFAITLAILLLLLYLGKTFLRWLKHSKGQHLISKSYLIAGIVLVMVSKMADRANRTFYELFAIDLSARATLILQSVEESGEMLMPVCFLIALLAYRPPLKP